MNIPSNIVEKLESKKLTFHSIIVAPTQEALNYPSGSRFRGGPNWPDFDKQREARFCRGRHCEPIDAPPLGLSETVTLTLEEAVWCGPVVKHFGHMLADFGMRIAQSAFLSPHLPLLFSIPQNADSKKYVESFFYEILKLFNIDKQRIIFVAKPVKVTTLHVYPQAERLMGGGPSQEHLQFMDTILPPLENLSKINILYVSRARYLKGGTAGEHYLDQIFTEAGVTVIHPELLPLTEQIELYRRADKIIFMEGSAVHALQLIGHLNADIAIICRRPKYRISIDSLPPRVRSILYLACIDSSIFGLRPSGHNNESKGICLLNPDKLTKHLSTFIPNIETLLDKNIFTSAQMKDLCSWYDVRVNHPKAHPNEKEHIKTMLFAADITVTSENPTCMKRVVAHMPSIQSILFPNAIQRKILSICKPVIRLFAPLEYCIKFECAPSDFFASSKRWDFRLIAALLSCFGPKPENTDFDIQTVQTFCNHLRLNDTSKVIKSSSTHHKK